MTRHLSDKTRETGDGRLRNFVRQERETGGPHPAVLALHARALGRTEGSGRRLVEYARIERGHRT